MLRPKPQKGINDGPYWEYCRKHELRVPKCRRCRRHIWPALPACPNDLSEDLEWVPVSTVGTISSWVVYHRVYHSEFKEVVPYICANIELPEGIRMTGNIFGKDATNMKADFLPEGHRTDLLNGRKVDLFFEDIGDEIVIPQWKLSEAE